MADLNTAQLEAARTMCLAALTACQGALETIEALIQTTDACGSGSGTDEFSSLTFEDTPPPIRRRNGKR